jgi:RNA polymerase sigma-70 factor, ECF subfamily
MRRIGNLNDDRTDVRCERQATPVERGALMDVELVVLARSGDREAFGQLAALSIGRLDAAARLIIRDRERARDVVQETLVRAWRSLPSLRNPERFDGWVRQLLVRACIDELRSMRRHVVEIELTDTFHPAVADSQALVVDRDSLRRAFRRLDPEQRSLIVLHYYLDLPLAEVADALEMPVGTAKSRLFRARATLRAALDADERIDQPSLEGRPA